MKKISFVLTLCLIGFYNLLNAQTLELSESDLNLKLDSILAEGHLLYQYEKSAWLSTDYASEYPIIREKAGGYFTYEYSKGIKTIILNKDRNKCIAEYYFYDNFNFPDSLVKRNLTELETKLLSVQFNILNKITTEPKYKIFTKMPYGYSINFVLIPFGEKYKFYILTGTTLSKIIPFGNDFLFITDKDGNVESWQKFHSVLLPTQKETEVNGIEVNRIGHSHLETTPFITATEIATFKLYAPLCDISTFFVMSPALDKVMIYDLQTDKITIEEYKNQIK